ncbi:MAG: pyruvate formate lyase family protein [Anaerolineae bacterium]|jgi:pyruvate-formate lyase
MSRSTPANGFTFAERYDALRATKLAQTREKQQVVGSMDHDDWGMILPPENERMLVDAISGSGMPIKDVLLKSFTPEPNHPSGGFFGPAAVGANFGALMKAHPVYVDPMASLAGGYMVNFRSYCSVSYPPEMDLWGLPEKVKHYNLSAPLFGQQHFCQDMQIGLDLGYGGLLNKVRRYRDLNAPEHADFYAGEEAVLLGLQDWIGRTAAEARRMAEAEERAEVRQNLFEVADMNDWLVTEPPRTYREACQWILWYLMMARMYNGSGSGGRLDVLLTPYYLRDTAAGILTREEAEFHFANVLLRDTTYLQLGGPDETGRDVTNEVSFVILEAAHHLRIPTNVGVSVGEGTDRRLLRRAVEIQFEDRAGTPKFLGTENIVRDFQRNGIPEAVALGRAYSGCHWFAIPGREYTLNDCAKVNLGRVFELAFQEVVSDAAEVPSLERLWERFVHHLEQAVAIMADVYDFHVEHKHQVFPELALNLCSYGPIEKGLDASHHGVEYINFGLDAAALATVADSFAAIEQRVVQEGRLSWTHLAELIESDWGGPDGEQVRLMMRSIPRFGSGGSAADGWAVRVTEAFIQAVKAKPTPNGYNMIPGHFSWANTIPMGKVLGATPNGRHAGAPISHGANPDPGFRRDGAPSAMATAIASVQCGWGNSSPMQIELEPGLGRDEGGVDNVCDLIRTHMEMGGTQVNLNVMDASKVLEAHKDPSLHPDLVVRVTGFSAYFASLSPQFRQLVVDRIIRES